MEKTIKIISILMMFIMVATIAMPVFATGVTPDTVIDSLDDYDNKDLDTDVYAFAGRIIGFLRNASYIIAVIVLVVLGIKYMMGSLEEKAEYKKTMIPLVVGIVIVIGATTIAKFLFDTFTITSTPA